MTVDELKSTKAKLEDDIKVLIGDFEIDTECCINDVYHTVAVMETMTTSIRIHTINVTVSLDEKN